MPEPIDPDRPYAEQVEAESTETPPSITLEEAKKLIEECTNEYYTAKLKASNYAVMQASDKTRVAYQIAEAEMSRAWRKLCEAKQAYIVAER